MTIMVSLGPDASAWRKTYRSQADHRRRQIDLVDALCGGPRLPHGLPGGALRRHRGQPPPLRPMRLLLARTRHRAELPRPDRAGGAGRARHSEVAAQRPLTLDRAPVQRALSARGSLSQRLRRRARRACRRRSRAHRRGQLREGRQAGELPQSLAHPRGRGVRRRRATRSIVARATPRRQHAEDNASRRRPAKNSARSTAAALSPEGAALEQRLREWRLAIAKKEGKPAFFVFGDSVLRSIAHARPRNLTALAAIHGVGAAKLERFGADVCRLCAEVLNLLFPA